MHRFTDLIDRSTSFIIAILSDANQTTTAASQTSAATSLVKNLQMIQLQKAIVAVGMFSLFEAALQDGLGCADGFDEASRILTAVGEGSLREEFSNYQRAINVLKHGRGRSYDFLVAKAPTLPFRIKLPTDNFFEEGDVSEVSTLIEVDDSFLRGCNSTIQRVSEIVRSARPDYVG